MHLVRLVGLGFLVGLPIAAAPGPIFFLCLRRTLARGWRSGLAAGLGVATADAIYASLAAFGIVALTTFVVRDARVAGAYLSMVALTLTNPQTILAFGAVFARLGLRVGSGLAAPISLVIGVLLGSSALVEPIGRRGRPAPEPHHAGGDPPGHDRLRPRRYGLRSGRRCWQHPIRFDAGMSAFYAVTAASAATLVGLLFVAVQIGPSLVTAGPIGRRHAIARSTFTIFAVIFPLSLFLMLPTPSASVRSGVVMAAAAAGAVRAVLTWLPVWRDKFHGRAQFRLLQTAWLLIGPLLTYAYLVFGGILQLRSANPAVLDPYASGGFILLFVIALRNSWNLLVEARRD